MVVGYRGGDFNSLGRYYVVQQKHAHAWVEAYLPTDEVEATEIAGPPTPAGVWYRLDPTPASREGLASDEQLQALCAGPTLNDGPTLPAKARNL